MRNAHERFMCFPSVVCVGKETKVTVFPRDISRAFDETKEYELGVFGLWEDQVDYHDPMPMKIPCTVSDGCLHFVCRFDREQEYSVRFREKGAEKVTKVAMYAVKEDLYQLRPLKGDLHTHTYYSDGRDGVPMTPADYREEGFDFYALTDHNRMFTSVMQQEVYQDVALGICMLQGEELHTPGSGLHIVHVGGEQSVCDRYINDRENYEAEVTAIEAELQEVPEQYRHRLASAKWACAQIKKVGGISILAHPFWRPDLYNLSEDFLNLLFDARIFDAFELHNGGNCHVDNLQLGIWQEQAFKGNVMPTVASSDSHDHDFSDYFARSFTVLFAKDNTRESILEAIRSGYSVAAEIPRRDDNEVHMFSPKFRLTAFARFLYDHYFNETWRLCVGEGILMRRYVQGEAVGDTLSALAGTVKEFYERFYGLAPAPTLPAERLAYLAKLKKAQQTCGLETSGSKLYLYGKNTRRE